MGLGTSTLWPLIKWTLLTGIVTPAAMVVRGRGRVMTPVPQVTIDWAMVGHPAMEGHEDGPP